SGSPMPIATTCPHCAAKIKAPDNAAGKKAACPKCKYPLVVPVSSQAAAPVPPAVHHEIPVISQEVVEDDQLESLEAVESPYHPAYKRAAQVVTCPQCQTGMPASAWDKMPVVRCPHCNMPLTLTVSTASGSPFPASTFLRPLNPYSP